MDKKEIKALYLKFVQGECSVPENRLLIEYLKTHGNEDDLPSYEEVLEVISGRKKMNDEVSRNILRYIENSDSVETPRKTINISRYKWMWGAAALLIASFAVYLLYFSPGRMQIVRSESDQKQVCVLPDGTRILLNSNSEISYRGDFGSNHKREVWITGEAKFNVAHDKTRPFIVHGQNGFKVEVLGTTFSLKSLDGQTRVVLHEGSIKVGLDQDTLKTIILKPGEMASLRPDKKIDRTEVDTLVYSAWEYDLIPFKKSNLQDVTKILTESYGIDIIADSSVEHFDFTGALPTKDLDKALKTIQMTLDCQVVRLEEQKFMLRK